jgi:hypothetical protein
LCSYFEDKKRLSRSCKLSEYRRMYEALNDAGYFTLGIDEKTGETPSYQEKEILFDEMLLKGTELAK